MWNRGGSLRNPIPSIYIRVACARTSGAYPCGLGWGMYRAPHCVHRYRWLPASVKPSLLSFLWLYVVDIPSFYPISLLQCVHNSL
jgi:hypothetical protein